MVRPSALMKGLLPPTAQPGPKSLLKSKIVVGCDGGRGGSGGTAGGEGGEGDDGGNAHVSQLAMQLGRVRVRFRARARARARVSRVWVRVARRRPGVHERRVAVTLAGVRPGRALAVGIDARRQKQRQPVR